MKKRVSQIVACLLALTLVLSACAQGGGGTAGTVPTGDADMGEFWIGNYTLSKWVPFAGPSRERIASFAENLAYIEKQRQTGVTINWIHPPAGEEATHFSVMMAALDLPDLIQEADRHRGGIGAGVHEGLFVRLNELAEQYAPNYMRLVNYNEHTRREAFTDDGYLLGFGMFVSDRLGDDWSLNIENPWPGPFIRYDWLQELGLGVPETIDEWEVALKGFRDTFNPEVPLHIYYRGWNLTSGGFLSAFDTGPAWIQRDGQVSWGFAEPGFGDYLRTMARWFEEGLIDPEFMTRAGADVTAMAMRGDLGARMHESTAFPLTLEPEGIHMVGAPMPRLAAGSPPVGWTFRNNWIRGQWTVVTSLSDHPEVAVRWMDWNYSIEGTNILNFGPQGVTFDEFDDMGRPIYFEEWGGLNFDLTNNVFRIHNGPHLLSSLRNNPRRSMEHLESFRNIWEEQSFHAHLRMPPVTMTAEEGAEYASIMVDADALRDEFTIGVITGVIPVSELDTYFANLEAFGIGRAAEIQQAALERFMAR